MLHHADNLKIRIDYFRPKRAALPFGELWRLSALVKHHYALHVSVLGIMLVSALASVLA